MWSGDRQTKAPCSAEPVSLSEAVKGVYHLLKCGVRDNGSPNCLENSADLFPRKWLQGSNHSLHLENHLLLKVVLTSSLPAV